MLVLDQVSVDVSEPGETRPILSRVSAHYPLGHFGAIIGPSGCGKTTLLQAIAGVAPGRETGEIIWKGRHLARDDFHSAEMGYVPQFDVAFAELTVAESVTYALRLRGGAAAPLRGAAAVEEILAETGLRALASQRVATLSGGQRRRLALAMELTSEPEILLCDEVTSGLDPESESEIVGLLREQASRGRLVLVVTHDLAHLRHYDSLLVLVGGVVAYHGTYLGLCESFQLAGCDELYARLASQPAAEWAARWEEHSRLLAAAALDAAPASRSEPRRVAVPGRFAQAAVLIARRFHILLRSRSQLLAHALFILALPMLVAIFAWGGLPTVEPLELGLTPAAAGQFAATALYLAAASKAGALVSGLALFQVVLMTLMGANNAGREIASDRAIFEHEKLAGLRPSAYVLSKCVFLAALVVVQSVWMASFVHGVCRFPGSLGGQIGYLLLGNAAMTSICLAISSLARSAEQASLLSIYLVGFQLPLSGAVLALPEPLGLLLRPTISAYPAWSGMLQTLRGEHHYEIVQQVIQTPLAPPMLSTVLLVGHVVTGLLVTAVGCYSRKLRSS